MSKKDADGFSVDIESATKENDYFRKVIYTGPNAQLVLMSLKPGEDIGLETHHDLDQFIRLDSGGGKAVIGGKEYKLKNGSAIVVPAGSEHNVIAGPEGMKLYTVYTKNNHPDMVIDKTKEDAEAREATEMKKSSIILALIPGRLSKGFEGVRGVPDGSGPDGKGPVNGKKKGMCHTERMKLAKLAASRMQDGVK